MQWYMSCSVYRWTFHEHRMIDELVQLNIRMYVKNCADAASHFKTSYYNTLHVNVYQTQSIDWNTQEMKMLTCYDNVIATKFQLWMGLLRWILNFQWLIKVDHLNWNSETTCIHSKYFGTILSLSQTNKLCRNAIHVQESENLYL